MKQPTPNAPSLKRARTLGSSRTVAPVMELAEHATESIVLYAIDGTVRYANPAALAAYGWDGAEISGRPFSTLLSEHRDAETIWTMLSAGGGWNGSLRRRLPTGLEVVADARLILRRDAAGHPADVVEYSMPMTDIPDAVEASRDAVPADRHAHWQFDISELRSLLAASRDDAGDNVEWHRDRLDTMLSAVRIADVNDAALALFGLRGDRTRVAAKSVASVWPEETRATLADLIECLAEPGKTGFERREIAAAGRLTDVVLTGWRAGDPRCSHTVFVRVEGTMDAPTSLIELEASEDRYRNMIASLPIPVWQIDARAAGRIFERLRANGITDMAAYSAEHPELVDLANDIVLVSDVNQEAVSLLGGVDRADLVGSIGYLFAGTPGSARRVMLAHFDGVRNYVEALKVEKRDGSLIDVLLLVTFPVPGERLDTTIIMMIDNSARLQAEASLRQLEADLSHAARLSTLGELSTSIAHEVKQPLSAILMNAQTSLRYLARPSVDLDKIGQLTTRVADSAQRASAIIGRIQDMAGKREPTRTRLSLNDVVRDCLLFIRHESSDKAVEVRATLDPRLPDIVGDRVQLQQIIVNLIVNGIQAMSSGSGARREIIVTTRLQPSDGVVLSVRDTGCGIDEKHLDQIFDSFFSTKDAGLGIGLAICRSIAAAHGGRISASNHPDGGAEFRLSLPVPAAT